MEPYINTEGRLAYYEPEQVNDLYQQPTTDGPINDQQEQVNDLYQQETSSPANDQIQEEGPADYRPIRSEPIYETPTTWEGPASPPMPYPGNNITAFIKANPILLAVAGAVLVYFLTKKK